MKKCPGSLSFSQPKPDIVKCPDCGTDVEIWSDEATGSCPSCSKSVIRTVTQSCVDWCKYAKECLGDEKFKKYGEMKAVMRKPALMTAMAVAVGSDARRIEHAGKVASYAEMILAKETHADPNVVLATAILHDLDNANETIREILIQVGYPELFSREVCDIARHLHQPRPDETINFKILHDAHSLAETEKQWMRKRTKGAGDSFAPEFLTESAMAVFLDLVNAV